MAIDLEKEIRDLKRRADLTDTKIAQLEGEFGFIATQLKDVQLFMHARAETVDQRLDNMDRKIEILDQKVDALPKVLADMLAERGE